MAWASSDKSDGNDITAAERNAVRQDALTRMFVFDIPGTLATGDEQGPAYIIPEAGVVTKIVHKIASGTSATFRIQKDTTDVDAGVVASAAVATESSITSDALTAGQVLTLDITAISGAPAHLSVMVFVDFS